MHKSVFTLLLLLFSLTCKAEVISPDSLVYLCKKAEAGEDYALILIRDWYEEEGKSKEIELDYKKALPKLRAYANKGDRYAQLILGVCYYYGKGVDRNYEQASIWFRKSSDKGSSFAYILLGFCYYSGEGVVQNRQKALQCFLNSANKGNAVAQWILYDSYWGDGLEDLVERDSEQGLKWLRKAAGQDYLDALEELAFIYEIGQGVGKNPNLAAKWFRRAANKGSAYSQRKLGLYYIEGFGVKQNSSIAMIWLERAASQNDEDAKKIIKKQKMCDFHFYFICDLSGKITALNHYIVRFNFKTTQNKVKIDIIKVKEDFNYNDYQTSIIREVTIDPSFGVFTEGGDFIQLETLDSKVIINIPKTGRSISILFDKEEYCFNNSVSDLLVQPDEIAKLSISQKQKYFDYKRTFIHNEIKSLKWKETLSTNKKLFSSL